MTFCKKHFRKLTCIVLMLLIVVNSIPLSFEVKAASNSSAQSAVDNICNTVGFRPNVDNYGDCYAYVSAFCNKLYGSAPGGVSRYNLTRPGDFYLVGQTYGTSVTESSVSSVLSQAMPGDVVQMYWDYGTGSGPHTAIVYSADATSFTILQDGASFSTIKKSTYAYSSSYTRWKGSGYGISLYRHSNYSNLFPAYTEPPAYSYLSTDKTEYNINESVTFTCNTAATPNCNVIWIYHPDGETSYYTNVGTTLKVAFSEPGKYIAEVYAWNDVGNTKSELISFTVGNPAYSYLSTDKTEYNVNENVTFACNTDATPNCNVIWIYHPDGETSYYTNVGTTLKVAFSNPGKYKAEVYAWNSIGNTKSELIYFTVGNPAYSYLSTNKTKYNVNEDVIFTCNTDATPNCNVIWIYHPDGETSYYTSVGTTLKVAFSKLGKYKAEVYAWNSIGNTKSETIEFLLTSTAIKETADIKVDYNNFMIYTDVQNCNDITKLLSVSDTADITVMASQNIYIYGTGTVINVYEDDAQVGVFNLVVNGDTNGDSVCDVLDCAQVERVSSGNDSLSGVFAEAGDINGDDVIDITDYQAVVNKAIS